jgi:hypothetical protein
MNLDPQQRYTLIKAHGPPIASHPRMTQGILTRDQRPKVASKLRSNSDIALGSHLISAFTSGSPETPRADRKVAALSALPGESAGGVCVSLSSLVDESGMGEEIEDTKMWSREWSGGELLLRPCPHLPAVKMTDLSTLHGG